MDALLGTGIILGVVVVLGGWVYTRSRPPRAQLTGDGAQEATIVVRDRYQPPAVIAHCGVPLQLHFRRDEDNPCSQRVIFPDFGIVRSLPAWRTTNIDLRPDRKGEFLFTCEMGMYQGILIVVGHNTRWPAWLRTTSRSRGNVASRDPDGILR